MKITGGAPLTVALRWATDDTQAVGRLAYRDGIAYLEYDAAFLRAGLELSPIHHAVGPGLVRPYDPAVFEGLHGVFADSLPDGWGRLLVDRRARELNIEPATLSPLDRLACVGRQGIGALSYAPASEVWESSHSDVDLDRLAAYARLVLRGDAKDVISELGRVGGSPGGARPKALVALDDKGHAIHGSDTTPNGYAPYLVKLAGIDDPPDIAHIEQAYATMAAAAGIAMPPTRLVDGHEGRSYFAARRFDHVDDRRAHVHSASGLLYADFRVPSLDYRDIILLARRVTHDQRECRAMFALAAFNVLAHNRDDHARQFSFLMDRGGTWRLAPAYDLTFSQGPGGEHSTSVLGHGREITRGQLTELGRYAELHAEDVGRIIDAVQAAVADWERFAADCGVTVRSRRSISKALAAARV